MPTYEYQCNACHHGFELFQSMSAPVKRKCPKCGKSALERLIGVGAGVIFKGGGFYQTDYRSEGYKKAAKADSGAAESAKPADGAKPGEGAKPKPETASGAEKKPEAPKKKPARKSADD